MPGKYETPRGKAATDAKRRYYEKTYDRLYPAVKKGNMLIGLTQQGTRYRDGSGETRKELIGKLPAIIAEAKFIQIGLKILNPTMVGANQKRFQITDRDMNPLEIIIFRTVSFCTESTSFQTLIT